MSAEYMHIGIPITNKKPGMVHNEGAGRRILGQQRR